MQNVISFGKQLIPLEQIVFVESFTAARNPNFKPEKEFKARVVLLNRERVLAETSPREFAEAQGMPYLDEDDIAVNPAVAFKIETFTATDEFKPEKAYQTRAKWRDRSGNVQSKLLVSSPEIFIAKVLRGGAKSRTARNRDLRRSSANRPGRNTGKTEPFHP